MDTREASSASLLTRVPFLLSTCLLLGMSTILWTVLQQMFFKNRNEPPVVFHWFPIIGSAVTYGMDPFKFFFDCQAKV